MVISRGRLWGDYALDWSLLLSEMSSPPILTTEALVIKTNVVSSRIA
jgi:hypothetical protein